MCSCVCLRLPFLEEARLRAGGGRSVCVPLPCYGLLSALLLGVRACRGIPLVTWSRRRDRYVQHSGRTVTGRASWKLHLLSLLMREGSLGGGGGGGQADVII